MSGDERRKESRKGRGWVGEKIYLQRERNDRNDEKWNVENRNSHK